MNSPFENSTYSVSDVNKYIKVVLSNDQNLKFLHIRGEISNFKLAPTGHAYFSLKDKESNIGAVMFSTYASKLSFAPKNGDEVIVLASIDVYVPRGTYQLMVYEMNPVGQGNILLELEKLKKKLQNEGLFDENRKRRINVYPRAIGVITAPNGAAIRDIVTNIKRRYPIADIYVFPSSVQGDNAPKELLAAFNKSQEYDLDTLIIGRGGGASEDLGAFNDEVLVRAIAKSKMPVIAAVGHEVDFTLVDFVADKRASTPTGAAELATIDRREIEQKLDDISERLNNLLKSYTEDIKDDIESKKQYMQRLLKGKLELTKSKVEGISKYLEASNPYNILDKGYSLLTNEDGDVIKDIDSIKVGDKINTKLKNGTISSEVISLERGE